MSCFSKWIAFAGVYVLLGCGPVSPSEPRPELWKTVKSSSIGPGPVVHVATETLRLADGTQVVCVSGGSLWCREAIQDAPRIQKPQEVRQRPIPSPQLPPELDFGRGPQ